VAVAVAIAIPAVATASSAGPTGQLIPHTWCPAFPANNVWNTPITGLRVDPHSSEWLSNMAAGSTHLHPNFGPSGGPIPLGMPWQITPPKTRFVRVHFLYSLDSNWGPYPFAANTPVQGGHNAGGDRHALMVDPNTCTLYELWDAYYRPRNHSWAGAGAIWSLYSNKLRPRRWTSADAAGLPILPGLVNYDEVMSGHLDHAIRFTVELTDRTFIWPARHEASPVSGGAYPPMGARFRLRASFHLSPRICFRACQVVIRAMKTYGLILADNGMNWAFQGTADRRWTWTVTNQLKQIPARAFEAVDESCLIVNRNSGQALQPGTPAYNARCG
jgi:hypothetical protein